MKKTNNTKQPVTRFNRKFLASAVLLAMCPAVATAQDNEAEQSADVEQIVVTGSRIARRDESAPSPIMTVGEQFIEDTGQVNVEATMNEMPQFTRDSSGGQGTGGRALLDLRGLGATRNLILLDGRRLPISSSSGVVDTNVLPTSVVRDVEVITGGASAVYGSDAVSGVVNFVTQRGVEGVNVDVQYGNSMENDYASYNASVTAGAVTEKSSLFISVSSARQDALYGKDRFDFFQLGIPSSYIGTGTFVPSATNLPDQAVVDAMFAGYGYGSVPNNNNLGFNDDGSLFSQTGAVNYMGSDESDYRIVNGNVRMPVQIQGMLRPQTDRKNLFARFDYEFSPAVTGYAQALFTDHTAVTNSGGTLTQFGTPTIPVTNPFIPDDLSTLLASRADPTAPFSYNARYVMTPAKSWDENYVTQQYIVGLEGDTGFRDWTFDAWVSWDNSRHNQVQHNAVFLSRVQTLFNAADGGDSICAGGYNPFGLANVLSMSDACQSYISGDTHSTEELQRTAFDVVVQGSLFELPAGDVMFSASANYRNDEYYFSPDKALAEQDVQAVIAAQPSAGSSDVTELAVEFIVPVTDSFEIGTAYRMSDYEYSGTVNAYKLDGLWHATDEIMVRGGYQRAIRAPNINELFSAATGSQVTFGNPPSGGEPCDVRTAARAADTSGELRGLCVAMGIPVETVDNYLFPTTATATLSSGNIELQPETADTYTLGAVWNTEFGSNQTLVLSADYYSIEIEDVISAVPGLTAINKCHNLDGSNPTYSTDNAYCQLLSRDQDGYLELVRTPYFNLGQLATDGMDFQVNYKLSTGAGDFSVHSVITYVNSYEVVTLPGDEGVDEAGTIGFMTTPRPKLRAQTSFGYEKDAMSLTLRWRFTDSMDDRSTLTNTASTVPGVPSYNKFDLVGRYRLTESINLRGGISNLFDKDPLVVAGTPGITDNESYDIVGRSYFVGATMSF